MAMTSWAETEALVTDRQCQLEAEAVRQRRILEAEQALYAAVRQVRYRDAVLVAVVFLFALLAFSLGEEDTETRRIRSNIVDPADVVLVEPTTDYGVPTS